VSDQGAEGKPRLGQRFNLLWSAAGVSNLGDGIMWTALPLLVVTLTQDPLLVAAVSFAQTLPWFLFALVSGALVDRLDRRIVMVRVDAVRALIVATLGVLVVADAITIPWILALAFLLGTAETLFDTASEAIIPALVPDGAIPVANSRLQGTLWVMNSFIGPPLGAFLFAVAIAFPFFIDAATFAAAAGLIALISGRYKSRRSQPEASVRSEIAEGLRWLYHKTVLFTLALMAGVTNFFAFAFLAVFVLFVTEDLGLSALQYGLIGATVGVGGLVGALIAPRIIKRVGPGTTVLGTVGIGAVLALMMTFVQTIIQVGVIASLWGLSITAWNVVSVSLRQELTPDELRGRVASVARLLAWGTQPLGALAGGIIATKWGLRAPFLVAAAGWGLMFIIAIPFVNNRTIRAARAETETDIAADGAG